MNENDIKEKLNEFKDNFSFITDEPKKLDSLVKKSFDVTLKDTSIDDPYFYKKSKLILKSYIKALINYEYQKDRNELFNRAVSLLLIPKRMDVLRKTEIFSAFVKAIDEPIEEEFFQKVLADNPKISTYINGIIVTDGKKVLVDPVFEDYCNNFMPLINLYMDNLDSSDYPYIKRINNNNSLNRVEVIELFRRVRSGDEEAVSILIKKNKNLVLKIVSRYHDSNIDFDDLYQEGLMGLLRAIELFDVSRGIAFSTYAVNWIMQHINRYIQDNRRAIRIPVHLHEKMNRTRRRIEQLENEEGRILSIDEISEKLKIPLELLKEYNEYSKSIDSINRRITDDSESSEIGHFIRDERDTYHEMFEDDFINRFLEKLKTIVDKRSFDIFCRRHGYLGYDEQTLEEIGEIYGVSRERIRQIENKVNKKIKSHYFFRRFLGIKNNVNSSNESLNSQEKVDSNINGNINEKTGIQDFVTHFRENYGIEDIDMLLSSLTKTDIDCLKSRFGENLSTVNDTSNRIIADANYIVFYKIPKLFNLETSVVCDKMEFASNDNLVRRLILIKPYLVGLRDSLNSMIGIIDNHCEERNKCKVKRIESSE